MSKLAKFDEFSKKERVFENVDAPAPAGDIDISKKAANKITASKIRLVSKAAFFGQLAAKLKFEESRSLPFKTMATDGFKILYDPEFVLGHTDEEIRWVICHEIMHCALFHFMRKQANPQVWNAAADYAINLILDTTDTKKYPDNNKDYREAIGKMPKGGLLDRKYENMSAEQIYQYLIENNVQLPPEEGWNYGNVEPPVFVPAASGSSSGSSDDDFGQKAKIGDYVKLPNGDYGKIKSIDSSNGDAEIDPLTEAELKKLIEAESGRTVKKIK